MGTEGSRLLHHFNTPCQTAAEARQCARAAGSFYFFRGSCSGGVRLRRLDAAACLSASRSALQLIGLKKRSRELTMKTTAVILLVAFCAVAALDEDVKKSKPSATESPADLFTATTNSSTTPTPKPTTPKPTTPKPTTPKPTTPKPTTPKPTTPKPTTPKPTTPKPTTHKPTTPKPTTHKPTTPKPTTHKPTTHKTTPSPPPTPTPSTNLTVGNYTLTDKKVICLMAQMAVQIRLENPKVNGTFIVQPKMTKAEGGCKETTANLTLVFKEGHITLMFNKTASDVYVDTLSFALSYSFGKGGNSQYTANNKSVHLFNARLGHSYSCKSESLYMGNGLYLDVNQDRMQAFNLTKNDFGSPDPCPADKPDYRVAIAVGVTLLVLIIIVVVAYLLGRRKRADGYQSL